MKKVIINEADYLTVEAVVIVNYELRREKLSGDLFYSSIFITLPKPVFSPLFCRFLLPDQKT